MSDGCVSVVTSPSYQQKSLFAAQTSLLELKVHITALGRNHWPDSSLACTQSAGRALVAADVRCCDWSTRSPTVACAGSDSREVWTSTETKGTLGRGTDIHPLEGLQRSVLPCITLPCIIGPIRAPNGACCGAKGRVCWDGRGWG